MNRPSKKTESEAVTASAALAPVRDEVAELRAQLAAVVHGQQKLAARVEQTETKVGPCRYCGVGDGHAQVMVDGYNWAEHDLCAACEREMPLSITGDLPGERINQWRHEVFRRLVPDRRLTADPRECGVLFFYELPATKQRLSTQRWGHLDADLIRRRARLALKKLMAETASAPNGYQDGDPCPRCGCAHMWLDFEGIPGYAIDGVFYDPVPPSRVCAGCRSYEDFDDAICSLLGIKRRLSTSFYEAAGRHIGTPPRPLGIGWYSDLPENDKRRSLTKAPFQYMDLGDLRRKVYHLGYSDPSNWRSRALWEWVDRDAREG